MSRGAWAVAGIGVAALASGSAFAGTQYAKRVQVGGVTPAPNAAVASARPLIAFDAPNADKLTSLTVVVDGRDVTRSVGRDSSGRIVVGTRRLKEGRHTVSVSLATRNIFSRTVRRRWAFTVDTKLPGLKLTTPTGDAINRRTVAFTGTTEPGATVTLDWKAKRGRGTVTAQAPASGRWSTTAKLPEGRAAITLRAVDRAGNARVATSALTVDTVAPKLSVSKLPAKMTTDDPLVTGRVTGDSLDRAVIGAEINGEEVVPARVGVAPGDGPTLSVEGNRFEMSMGALPQGRSTVTVFVRDAAGNRTGVTSKVFVDSTDEFGSKNIVAGAVGDDVKTLQERLKERGFKQIRLTGVYDEQTEQAVTRYQKRVKLKQSGLFTTKTREAFVGKIVIIQSKFRIQLMRDNKVVMKFPIAVGQSAYPTPVGEFYVVNKQSNPTWTPPPDSSWAKGLGPIPPGPGNPLGTRWIGTSAPYVGIHGTNAPSSIGTRASHGCIRMRIPDVEKLYEQVAVGMPVQIKQ